MRTLDELGPTVASATDFVPPDLSRACPGWAYHTYKVFLAGGSTAATSHLHLAVADACRVPLVLSACLRVVARRVYAGDATAAMSWACSDRGGIRRTSPTPSGRLRGYPLVASIGKPLSDNGAQATRQHERTADMCRSHSTAEGAPTLRRRALA